MGTKPEFAADATRLSVIAAFLGLCVLVAVPPIEWLPSAGDAPGLLGALLAAQAAIAALTLAVTIFVLQGVGARRDAADRVYGAYVRQSRVYCIFYLSVGAVGVTGAVLAGGEFVAGGAPVAQAAPGFANLTLVAVGSFAVNLLLAVELFRRGLQLTRPDEWRKLRRGVDECYVRSAVQAFLSRKRRSQAEGSTLGTLLHSEPDEVIPLGEEGAANEALGALLRDSVKAMGEWRQEDFEWSLTSVG